MSYSPATPLCDAPTTKPLYPITVKDNQKNEQDLADPRAVRSALALMNLGAVNGGAACHWGGPSAMVECMSALHGIMFQEKKWFEHFNFINDIGHGENGIYALRSILGFGDLSLESLRGFRSIESKLTGHGESHLYPEGVLLSNGPLSSALAQAQGLAMGDKLLKNNRITVSVVSDGASMEGEARESFAAIPGLAKKNKINPFLLIVSDNNTKLSGRIDGDSYSMNPSFQSLQAQGWETVVIENGHDLENCYQTLEKCLNQLKQNPQQPIFLWVKTVKGYGIKSTEEHSAGGHGFPLKAYDEGITNFVQELWDGKAPEQFLNWAKDLTIKPQVNAQKSEIPSGKMQLGISKAAIDCRHKGLPVISVSADLQGSTGMAGFQKEFPQYSFDMGIAESNMVSSAAGMAKTGFIPIVDTFAAFGITKGNLPLIMASLSDCPIISVFSHTGFQDAADGASHQSLTYFSAVSSIPKQNIIAVATAEEAEVFLTKAIENIDENRKNKTLAESFIFFLGRENFPLKLDQNLNWQQDAVLKQGEDLIISATGPLVHQALKAAEMLKTNGIQATVINHRFLNKVDTDLFRDQLGKNKGKLITVEDHQLAGGIGSFLVNSLISKNLDLNQVVSLGVNGTFGQSAYLADHLYQKHGIDSAGIFSAAQNLALAK
jgi:transketolase